MRHVVKGDTKPARLLQEGDWGSGFAMDGCNQRDGHNQRDGQGDMSGSIGHSLHQSPFL